METATIQIQGHDFVVPYRYSEGHMLKANEAKALNQTLHENFRNNFAPTVKAKMKEIFGDNPPEDAKLEEHHLAELQASLDDVAEKYEFNVRTGGGAVPRDPVAAEAFKMALAAIKDSIRHNGGSVKEYDSDKIAEAARKLVAEDPDYTNAAEEIVARRQVLAAKTLGMLPDKAA